MKITYTLTQSLAQVWTIRRSARLRKAGIAALALMAVLALVSAVLAQASAEHDVSWRVVAGGGGRMESAGHTLLDTVGQPVVGGMDSAGYRLEMGYWRGAAGVAPAPEHWVYLPFVLRGH